MSIKRKIILLLVLIAVGLAIIIYFIIIPTVSDIRTMSMAVYNERVDLEKKYLRGQLLKKTIEDFDKIKPQEAVLASAFIPAGNELEFVTAVESIAAKYKVEHGIKLQSDQTNEGAGFYYSLPLQIMTQGTFSQTFGFLVDLEKLSYYFDISDLVLTAQKNSVGEPTISMTATGKIFILPQQKKSTSGN